MGLLSQLIAMNRARQLSRQFRDIERCINALPKRGRSRLGELALREIGQASRSDFPHLYGTPSDERYRPWGQGTTIGFARARSENPEVALRGIALWLAVAYHETKDSPYPSLQPHYRQLTRVLRELKEAHSADSSDTWMNSPAAA